MQLPLDWLQFFTQDHRKEQGTRFFVTTDKQVKQKKYKE
jgi:hypothetical protein